MATARVTAKSFPSWVKQKRYSVLMVKLADCFPCERALPLYQDVATKRVANKLVQEKEIQFGIYTIQDTLEDKLFAKDELGIRTVPTFYIYDSEAEEYIFVVSSAKKINDLDKFVATL